MSDEKVQLPQPGLQWIVGGRPANGYKIFIYEAGTTTKAETWTDASGLTPNTNPAILDADGRMNAWVPPIVPLPIVPNPPGPPGPRGPAGPPGPPGGTGNLGEFSTTVDIPSSDIYGMFGNYIVLAPNDDAAVMLIPTGMDMSYKYQTTPYETNGGSFVVNWGPPIIPVAVPGYTFAADTTLESVSDVVKALGPLAGLIQNIDAIGKPLTLTLDAAPDGAPLITIAVVDGGTGYAVGDTGTIAGGDAGATYEVDTESGGVVTGITLTAGGMGYVSSSAAATATGGGQPGAGTGLTLNTVSAQTISGSLRITTYYRRFVVVP